MSVYYRLYQNKLKNSKVYGKYFARAVHTDMVDLDDIAEIIERNCTLKRSDVKACLTELVEVMRDKMQSSNKVRINGLGIFKINVKSTGVDAPGDFKGSNIMGYRVNFEPEHTMIKAKGVDVDGKPTSSHVNSYYLFEGISAKRASLFSENAGSAEGSKSSATTDDNKGANA
ncbi:HU family DNA-binding protein [Hallella absiana]|uniref:HU family DNA-binding protein n=1 Tax=Hallella absiana TaxID=2925336 RepID=UPI0021C73983|nr:HU family DNA-binding protein [Hallella absiana]